MNELKINSQNKRTIEYGGISKEDLLEKLQASGIRLNSFAEIIFSSEFFKTSIYKHAIQIAEISIGELGFDNGATIPEIKGRIKSFGLAECPLELAPYLRLKFPDQQEVIDGSAKQNQSPPGAVTIFSELVTNDDDFPKGFYLRKIDGELWLRGFTCSMDFVWNREDRLIFKVK